MSYRDDDDRIDNDENGEEEEDAPEQVVELAQARTPSALKAMRACMRCGIIKTYEDFDRDGCENCPFLEMQERRERCLSCTTGFFEGTVAIMDPRESWTSKWLRCDGYLPGVYAITVTGQFTREIEEDLENKGIRWRCRP